MISIEILLLLITAFVVSMIVLLVALQGWKIVVNRYFIMTALLVIPWTLGTAIFFGAETEDIARMGLLIFYVAPMFMMLFLSLFAAVFPAQDGNAFTLPNRVLSVMAVVISAVAIYNQDLLTVEILMNTDGNNQLLVDPLWYTIYFCYFGAVFSVVFYEFLVQIRSHKDYRKQQLVYIAGGMFMAVVCSTITNLILPLFSRSELIWLGPLWTLFPVVTITIAIIKHRLFDIKLAAVRTVAYILALGVLAGIYYFMAYIVSVTLFKSETTTVVSISPVNILLALVLAFMFQPIKRFFDRLTNNIFYRDMYKTDDFFASLSELLGSTTDLRGLLQRAATEIASTLKADQTYFFLYYNNGEQHHMSAGTRHHTRLPIQDAHVLDAFVSEGNKGIILTDLLSESSHVRRMLVSHRIALVMPIRYSGRLIGYVLLGEQQRSGGYNKRDLKVLTTIADELVIAIQNALSLHEIKEINATLQQRIDVATKELRSSNAQLRHIDEVKDEFISMASHQLRTPLTSVKGYISMVLEGDMGKTTPQQHVVLTEAFNSSERMVRLIGDFLNVSRLQTGKFVIDRNPVDLSAVVQGEVDSLQLIASTHNMKLEYVGEKKEIIMPIDEAKVRQVIMNFIDNAIFYSHPNTTITVKLDKTPNGMEFRVIDTGIGVPKEEQAMLFNKFFRAKNARKQRPDGTGVGLYLAKKVITAHRGKMIYSSTEGKGSTFGFVLPLDASD